mgnify:CR=1 FL=1
MMHGAFAESLLVADSGACFLFPCVGRMRFEKTSKQAHAPCDNSGVHKKQTAFYLISAHTIRRCYLCRFPSRWLLAEDLDVRPIPSHVLDDRAVEAHVRCDTTPDLGLRVCVGPATLPWAGMTRRARRFRRSASLTACLAWARAAAGLPLGGLAGTSPIQVPWRAKEGAADIGRLARREWREVDRSSVREETALRCVSAPRCVADALRGVYRFKVLNVARTRADSAAETTEPLDDKYLGMWPAEGGLSALSRTKRDNAVASRCNTLYHVSRLLSYVRTPEPWCSPSTCDRSTRAEVHG